MLLSPTVCCGLKSNKKLNEMNANNYKPRLIDDAVETYLQAFGAVCIEGPKWCGKTWTSSYHSKSEILIGDPAGDFQNRRLAQMSPALVLEGESPRLIDEWQEVPPLWDAVRHAVDQRGRKGQFILTGSATPNHKGILHSGAGRIGKLRMRPMSLFESGRSSGAVSLREICENRAAPAMLGEVDLRLLIECVIRGGWPANQDVPLAAAALLPREYIRAILDDDVFRMDGVKRDRRKMELLLRSLARNEATTATNRSLKNDIRDIDDDDVDVQSVASYLDVFARLFLTDNQKPFEPSLRSSVRIKQAEKRHLADPSLAAGLLNATPQMLLGDLNTLGFLFEALCERDLRIYAEAFGAELFHYQDYRNNEMDAVISLPDGSWCGMEIKLGANQIDAAAANLIRVRDLIQANGGQPPSSLCVVCGLSNAAYKRPDGVFVVPITALKP